MDTFLKYLLKLTPVLIFIIFILLLQLSFGWTNITGILLFSYLLVTGDLRNSIILAVVISFIYDSVQMVPLGSWSLSFFLSTLPIFIYRTLRGQSKNSRLSYLSQISNVIEISASSILQMFMLNTIQKRSTSDLGNILIIIIISAITVVLAKIFIKQPQTLKF